LSLPDRRRDSRDTCDAKLFNRILSRALVASPGMVVNAILSVPAWAIYLVVGLLAFGESAAFVGLFLPGETALLLAGMMAGTGRISLLTMLVIAALAAVGGDSVGFEIGRWGGKAIRGSRAGRWVGEERWERGEDFVRRRGPVAVLLGRWVGIMRALVPALAGMTGMPYRRFLLFNAVGGVLWSTAVVVAGYLAGASWHLVLGWLGTTGLVVGVAVAVAVGVALIACHIRHRVGTQPDGSRVDHPPAPAASEPSVVRLNRSRRERGVRSGAALLHVPGRDGGRCHGGSDDGAGRDAGGQVPHRAEAGADLRLAVGRPPAGSPRRRGTRS
jgi:membrane-associated protein